MDVSKNIFTDPDFKSVVTSACAFFEKTEALPLPLKSRFEGAGVYGIYYQGNHRVYSAISSVKGEEKNPIYIGKAVPPGWRQGRKNTNSKDTSLFSRLNEHCKSIELSSNLSVNDFTCRFVIMSDEVSSLIGVLESELISKHLPIWNSCIDGFGNHDPGAGRYEQARSEWDTIHPGRSWAEKLNDNPNSLNAIEDKGMSFIRQKR